MGADTDAVVQAQPETLCAARRRNSLCKKTVLEKPPPKCFKEAKGGWHKQGTLKIRVEIKKFKKKEEEAKGKDRNIIQWFNTMAKSRVYARARVHCKLYYFLKSSASASIAPEAAAAARASQWEVVNRLLNSHSSRHRWKEASAETQRTPTRQIRAAPHRRAVE